MFSGRVTSILRFGDIARSSSSPNLPVPGHFLWRQARLCTNKRGTPEELKEHIRDGVKEIDKGLLHVVMVNFRSSLREYIVCKRYHLVYVIFKSEVRTLNGILLLRFLQFCFSYIKTNLSKLHIENRLILLPRFE
jgi:hypothetical protein